MKNLLLIFFLFIGYNVVAQNSPSGVPTQFSTGWFRHGWDQSDSGKIFTNRNPNFTPRFPGTVEFYQDAGVDSLLSLWTGDRWIKLRPGFDSTSLSNRINLKLNISDTIEAWLGQSSRLVDTMYRVNDSTIGYTIKGSPRTFQILGRSGGGGGGGSGLTSVGVSMPSAFSVTNSPLTTNGTIAISGAGTTSQYIRGNSTLATTDSGMIPNFYLKVRGLFSASSPLIYNNVTGIFSIPNADAVGNKGVSTYNNSDFSTNGAGLVSLAPIIGAGSCNNCDVTFDATGRATAFSNGSGGGGGGVDSIYRIIGKDSIYFTIGSNEYHIKDSVGGGGGGTVTNVSGTANRITVTSPTTTPVVDIASTYVGQTSITTLGTIGTGTWNGTAIGPTFGGTGQTSITTGDLLYGSASNTWSKLADVATGNALISGGITTAPSWGKIGLTTHVSGILPVANGGTGTSSPTLSAGNNTSITGSWPNQTINAIPTAPLNSIQFNNAGVFGGDSLRYYPVENRLFTPKDYIQYGRPITGFGTNSFENSSYGKLWEVYPRGGSLNSDSISPFYSDISTTRYDVAEPENAVITLLGWGEVGSGNPHGSIRLEQNFYNDIEYHMFCSTPTSMPDPNSEVRHMSWGVDRTTATGYCHIRIPMVEWRNSDVTAPTYDMTYASLSTAGFIMNTYDQAIGSIAVTNGLGEATKMGIGMAVDTSGAGAGQFYVSDNCPVLHIGSPGDAMRITNPSTSGGDITTFKDLYSDAKEISANNMPTGALGLTVRSASHGLVWHSSTDASGYGVSVMHGKLTISKPNSYDPIDKYFTIENNLDTDDSIFHVRGTGDMYTKGVITARADSTPSATGGIVYRDAATGNFRISAGGGSETWQQALDAGSAFNKNNQVTQARYTFTMDGAVINKDTNRANEPGYLFVFGVSTDLGLAAATVLSTNWPRQVGGNLGQTLWNRAADGSTLNSYSGPSDSSFESKYPYIQNWDASIRYIVLGNYVINEAIHGTDSTTMGASVSKWIDSLIIHRGYPANRIIILNGHRSPAVLALHSQLPLLALATKNAAINKGVRYFDSYNYTLPYAAFNYSDSIHLNVKGQIALATGLIGGAGIFDSVNYTMINSLHVLKGFTNEGGSYINGITNRGSDSTTGRLYVGGNFSLDGNFEKVATFNKGVNITGDNTIGREWNLFKNGEKWGMKMGGSNPYHLDLYTGSASDDSVRVGYMESNGTTFHSLLSTSQNKTEIYSAATAIHGTTAADVLTAGALSVTGGSTIGREWNLFNNGEKWGMRMSNSGAPYHTQLYTTWSNAASAVQLGWMASDLTTFNPVLSVFQSGLVNIASLTNQNDTTTYKPLVVNSSGNIYKMNGWPVGSGSATTIYNGDGTLSGNRTVTGSNNNLTFADVNNYRVFADFVWQGKADGTRLYASAIDPSSTGRQSWQFAYSPFTRGVGLYVDTLNNVGLGDATQTNMPLYTTGNSAFVRNGFQSQQGNFYVVTNISTNTTLGLVSNFVTIDATSGNVTITLPAASSSFGASMGLDMIFKRLDNSGNTVTIQRAGSDTIDGVSTFTLVSQYESKKLRCITNSTWAIY